MAFQSAALKRRLIGIVFFFILNTVAAQTKNINYFLDTAIKFSPLLNDLNNQVISARLDSQILRASTQLQINGNGNSFYAPVTNGFGYDEILTNRGQLQALVTATKSLFTQKLLNAQLQSLKNSNDSMRIAARITEKDLRKSITTQYILTYGDQLQIQFNTELHQLLSSEEQILKKLTRNNVYRQVDYLSFLVTYQQQNLALQQLDLQYKNDYATLSYLSGLIDTSITKLEEPVLPVYIVDTGDSSVFKLKYTTDSLRLINARSLINLGYKPKINLFADAGFQSSFQLDPYKNFGYSFGLNYLVPIYDGGQRKLQLSKINIAERTRLRNKEFFIRQHDQQLAQLAQQLTATESFLSLIRKQIKYIETLIQANGRLMVTGDIKLTDYILAINNYITAQNLIVQNSVARLQIINQINYWSK